MYLLIMILHKEEFLDDVLSAFIELGVDEASILDLQSLGSALAYQVPIFSGLRFQMHGGRPYSKTIIGISDDPNIGKDIVSILKDSDIDIEAPGVGRVIVVDIKETYGSAEEIDVDNI